MEHQGLKKYIIKCCQHLRKPPCKHVFSLEIEVEKKNRNKLLGFSGDDRSGQKPKSSSRSPETK